MSRIIHAAVVAASLLLIATTASASQILFSGSVTGFQDLDGNRSSVPVGGFSIGDRLTGTLDVRDSALAPGAVFGNDDILGYRFLLGDTALADDFTSIGGMVNADGSGLSDFSAFTGLGYLGDDCALCSSEIRQDSFDVDSFSGDSGSVLGTLTARIIPDAVTDVPEPGSFGFGLAGFALIGLVALRRRQRFPGRVLRVNESIRRGGCRGLARQA